jgi:hypothetical protein
MRKLTAPALLAASVLVIGASATMAQNYPDRRPSDAPYSATSRNDGATGERRDTPYGQGGTAGTHDTGANVGPARAGMNHSTGE